MAIFNDLLSAVKSLFKVQQGGVFKGSPFNFSVSLVNLTFSEKITAEFGQTYLLLKHLEGLAINKLLLLDIKLILTAASIKGITIDLICSIGTRVQRLEAYRQAGA